MNAISNFRMPTPSLGGASSVSSLTSTNNAVPTGDSSFKNLLLDSLNQVNTMQHDADAAVQQLVTGGDVNPAEVLTSLQKADLSFRMVMQIRNKLVQAYQEVKDIRI